MALVVIVVAELVFFLSMDGAPRTRVMLAMGLSALIPIGFWLYTNKIEREHQNMQD
ncbi:hypothetical protein DC3_03460 [Deinococcus cellulosilyticus NBRC 106333 = KACC 11606]|uniref:Uncharacterized protein n=2 Tax=Deinococcus cellulosilyticus TaxID=401558 RepID=A0A511MWD7_DEIC1|nr:hypothetical protein DC3_03460 [Deinococcus cellulosilyticus NBRC 106333 = KACC 11606]